jgi:N-glycosylase/DNA lyase
MIASTITLRAPSDFDFRRTMYSHGWSELLPFSCDRDRGSLQRLLGLADGTQVLCELTAPASDVNVRLHTHQPLTRDQKGAVQHVLRSCLRMDESLSEFHAAARKYPTYRWIARSRSGRLLRSPTVFEDVVKMICTTNCTWALTTIMVSNLVHEFGPAFDNGRWGFPEPAAIAGTSEHALRTRCTTGYRAPFILAFAERVASGKLDVETWRSSILNTEELCREIRTVKGIGPYAAGNVLKLLGRYEHLALDSWVRAKFMELHTRGRWVKDSTIEKRYKEYGPWRGLIFWLEMTRYWHDDKFLP